MTSRLPVIKKVIPFETFLQGDLNFLSTCAMEPASRMILWRYFTLTWSEPFSLLSVSIDHNYNKNFKINIQRMLVKSS